MLQKSVKPSKIVAVILGVCIIPILYSFFYIWAFWNPYGNLATVPVAVVNQDQGASINGEQRNLGNEMVKEMKKGKEFKWIFVDSDSVARAGVAAGNYYTAIFIPKTFSSDIASASTTDKRTPVIRYLSNEKSNYTASKIISSAMTKIEEQTRLSVDKSITASLTDKLRAVPASLNTLHDGLTQLSDGSNSLSAGAGSAASGASQLATGASSLTSGLQTLYNGALSLSSGAGSAASGASQLATGASSLNSGLQTLNSGAQSLSAGASTAAGGASQVANGASSLNSGLQTLNSGAQSLSTGTSQAAAGAQTIADGTTQLHDGLKALQEQLQTTKSGNTTMADQINQLNSGAQQVSDGLNKLNGNQGISAYTALANGTVYASVLSNLQTLQTVATATHTPFSQLVQTTLDSYEQQMAKAPSSAPALLTLYEATSVLSSNTSISEADFEKAMSAAATASHPNLVSAGTTVTSSVGQLAGGSAEVSAGTQKLFDSTQTGGSLNTSVDQLLAGSQSLVSGASQLASNMPALANGAQQIASGASSAAAGSSTLSSGASQLASNMPALASGAQQIASGASSAAAGSSTLSSGASQLASNMPALASGAQQIASGTSSAVSGSATLSSGASQLAAGNASLASGATQLSNGLTTATQSVGNSVADANVQIKPLDGLDTYASAPLSMKSSSVYSVPNYGTGFAPYFVSVSLWAGALMMIAGLQIGKGKPGNPTQMRRFAMMRVAFYYIMAFMQGLALSIFLPLSLHIQVQNMAFYMLSNIVIALTFVSLILFCVTSFGIIGSFISVVLLVFQLTSSAGTFPLETTPLFFQKISPFLPMTYSVRLLREAISGFHDNYAALDIAFLLVLMLVLFTLNVIVTHIQTSRRISETQFEQTADINV